MSEWIRKKSVQNSKIGQLECKGIDSSNSNSQNDPMKM